MDNKIIEMLLRLDTETGMRWYYKPESDGTHSFIVQTDNVIGGRLKDLVEDEMKNIERFINNARLICKNENKSF